MNVFPFSRMRDVLDDEATRLMGLAFDSACKVVPVAATSHVVREDIADRIIEAAKRGERDPGRLLDAGLGSWKTGAIAVRIARLPDLLRK